MIDAQLFGMPLIDWGIFLLLGALFSIALLLVRRLALSWLEKLAARTSNRIDDVVLEIVRFTYVFFLVALAFLFALMFADFPARTVAVAVKLFILVALLQVVFWGNGLINWWIAEYRERNLETDAGAVTTIQAAGFICRLALLTIVLLLALDNMGFEITTLLAGLGVAGIAIGLALQNVFGDLLASLSIVFDKPFVIGDFIIVDTFMGTVEHIGLETTRLRSLTGEQIIMANSDLIKSRVRNYKRMSERRIAFSLGVTYDTPYAKVEAIPQFVREIVEAEPRARFDRAHFKSYGDFALIYEIVYYVLVPDYNVFMDIQQAINLAIHKKFEEEGIQFAFPTQTLILEQSSRVAAPNATGPEM